MSSPLVSELSELAALCCAGFPALKAPRLPLRWLQPTPTAQAEPLQAWGAQPR